ncbi:MAG TPA: acetyl-CoA carboxylase biotin carboxyl carrier protein [Candidatus Kapabacteria bacterium]|jgi:acetyl-CoA carboxylase biotin carboxyl carrier protein|nr:acetyl-CoA carboxylase biotin carboxyl carrier protein [Candidatus Kapabacteria bacterium]
MIDINYLGQLLEIFDKSSANDLRIEQDGTSIKLSKVPPRREESATHAMAPFGYPQMQMQMAPPQAAPAAPAAAPTPAAPAESGAGSAPAADTKKYHEIRSPIVGTFYRASSPDAPVFTEVGAEVSPGQVLCIIEAMKLMNEIECDTYGKVVKVLVENAQPVEYNQVLFLIDPS